MFAYQIAWSVARLLCKKMMYANMEHIQYMAQMASLAISTIIIPREKPSILSRMVLELERYLMLLANVLQQER